MQKELPSLLLKMETLLYSDTSFGYRAETHEFLQKYFAANQALDDTILLPLDFKSWPENFNALIDEYTKKRLYPAQTVWPSYSAYYGIDYAEHKFTFLPISFYAGYGLYNDKLHPVSFLVLNDRVFDPFAVISNITVECYYGIPIDKKSVHPWDKNRARDKYILDVHIEQLKAALSSA